MGPAGAVRLAWLFLAVGSAGAVGVANAGTVPVGAAGNRGDMRLLYPSYVDVDKYGFPPEAFSKDVGDVDGDGLADTIAFLPAPDDSAASGAWVTFTPRVLPPTLQVGGQGWRGLRILSHDRWYTGIAGLGDVNSDGRADIAISDRSNIYVVFGRSVPGGTIDTAALGSGGFTIRNTVFGTPVAVGDQNRDGRADLAFCSATSYGVKIVYTPPVPAGATLDASNLGAGGATLATGADGCRIASLGDLDNDGRPDLLVGWGDEQLKASRLVGVLAPAPGTTTDLRTAAASGRAFELDAQGMYLETMITEGDQNRDGRRDIGVVMYGNGNWGPRDPAAGTSGRDRVVAFTPPLGTRRSIYPTGPAQGNVMLFPRPSLIDYGDQDGDGVADLGGAHVIHLSAGPWDPEYDRAYPYDAYGDRPWPGATIFFAQGYAGDVETTIGDHNGDGKREFVSLAGYPFTRLDENGTYRADWKLDVFLSATRPVATGVEAPVEQPDGSVDFAATFLTAPVEESRTLAGRPFVELTDDATGKVATVRGALLDAGHHDTRAAMTVAPTELTGGHTYHFRVGLENGRALLGWTAPQSFDYHGPPPPPPPPAPDPATGDDPAPAPAALRTVHRALIRGTRWADRLVGGHSGEILRGLAGRDLLLAKGGDDRVYGGPGRDRLEGGAGNDRMVGGRGADHIVCGPGVDTAVVDGLDRVTGCEHVVLTLD